MAGVKIYFLYNNWDWSEPGPNICTLKSINKSGRLGCSYYRMICIIHSWFSSISYWIRSSNDMQRLEFQLESISDGNCTGIRLDPLPPWRSGGCLGGYPRSVYSTRRILSGSIWLWIISQRHYHLRRLSHGCWAYCVRSNCVPWGSTGAPRNQSCKSMAVSILHWMAVQVFIDNRNHKLIVKRNLSWQTQRNSINCVWCSSGSGAICDAVVPFSFYLFPGRCRPVWVLPETELPAGLLPEVAGRRRAARR